MRSVNLTIVVFVTKSFVSDPKGRNSLVCFPCRRQICATLLTTLGFILLFLPVGWVTHIISGAKRDGETTPEGGMTLWEGGLGAEAFVELVFQ